MIALILFLICGQQGGVMWSEAYAVSQIRDRQPVVLVAGEKEPADRARAHVCFTVSGAGEVRAVASQCGDPVLLAAATRSLRRWRFQSSNDSSVTAELTFQWRDHRGGLIWDRREYPVGEEDAAKLVRAVPDVARQFKTVPHLVLDVDWYPEERDGIFYLFHLYQPGNGIELTSGWYDVNAYTGEVWDGLEFKPVNVPSVRRARKRLSGAVKRYEGREPWTDEEDELLKNPCADRPR